MENFQRKLLIKKKKRLTQLINYIHSLDEIKVTFEGNLENSLFLKLKIHMKKQWPKKEKLMILFLI